MDKPRGVALGAPTQRAYEEHVTAIGEVAFYWNKLHEALGRLFAYSATTTRSIGMAVWYSVQSDRGQREMLLAALRAGEDEHWASHPKSRDDIKWLVDYVTRELSDRRNDAIHAPCDAAMAVFERPDGSLFSAFEIGPAFFLGNPRATKLKEKSPVHEFNWYAATAKVLADYADAMVVSLEGRISPWPQRPRLPSLTQSPIRKR